MGSKIVGGRGLKWDNVEQERNEAKSETLARYPKYWDLRKRPESFGLVGFRELCYVDAYQT